MVPVPKAASDDLRGRFREIVYDPTNLLINRVPTAGVLSDGYVTLHNGNLVPVDQEGSYYGSFSDILIINRGVHEPLEEYVFQELLAALPLSPVMLELGSYWAHYSMWLKKVRPHSTVFLVEPDIENLRAGKENFDKNGYVGEFRQAFVGKGQFEIDRFMNVESIGHIDIVHADIQGFELEMLTGAAKAMEASSIDCFFISTHSDALHNQAKERIMSAGYRVEIDSDFDKSTTSFDGFIFATSSKMRPFFLDFRPVSRCELLGVSPEQQIARIKELQQHKAPWASLISL